MSNTLLRSGKTNFTNVWKTGWASVLFDEKEVHLTVLISAPHVFADGRVSEMFNIAC